MATISATWNAVNGNWFSAGSWNEPNQNPPPPILHYVPNSTNDVYIADNTGTSPPTAFIIAYNGSDIVNSLNGVANATIDITGGSLTTLHGGGSNGLINVAAGAILKNDADTLSFNGGNLAGTLSGAGTMRFVNGTFNLNAGFTVTAATWYLTYQVGSGTVSTTVLNTDVAYAGNLVFDAPFGNPAQIKLNAHAMTLSGSAFLGGNVGGAGTLKVTGSATIDGLGIGTLGNSDPSPQAATFENAGAVTQNGGFGVNGTLLNDAGKTYTIATASSIFSVGAANLPGLNFTNNGTLSVTGTGQSNISGKLINNGTIAIGTGAELRLNSGGHTNDTQVLNGTISGAGQLSISFGHNTTLNATALTVATIYVGGGNGGGVLTLAKNISYGGTFTLNDLTNLAGHTLTLSGAHTLLSGNNYGGTIRNTGTAELSFLNVGNTGATATAAQAGTFQNSGTVKQTNSISVNGTVLNDAGKTYNFFTASNVNGIGDNGLSFTNNGTISLTGAGSSSISGKLINNGTIAIASGAELRLNSGGLAGDTQVLNGTVSGAGQLSISFGHNTTLNTTALTVATIFVGGGNGGGVLTLAKDIGYAGTFTLNDILVLNGHTLTLSGASTSLSGNVAGPGTLKVSGTATASFLSIGYNGSTAGAADVATFENAGTLTQVNTVSVNGTLLNDAGKTYTIIGGNISSIGDVGLTFTNNGTLGDTALGVTSVGSKFTNNGTISIAAGATLNLTTGGHTGDTQVLNGTISGAGTLNLGFGHDTTLNPTMLTVAALSINGGNGGGTVRLGKDLSYAGTFTYGDQFGILDLNGHNLTLSGTSAFSGSGIDGTGALKVTGTATAGFLNIGSDGSTATAAHAVTFENAGSLTQNGGISVNGTVLNDAGHSYTIGAASNLESLGDLGLTFANNGNFIDDAAGTSRVNGAFTNNGMVIVDDGTLIFSNLTNIGVIEGVITQNGSQTIVDSDAPGQTTLTGGSGDNRIVVDTAPTHVDGGAGTDTLAITASMTLAAGSLVSVERIEVGNGLTVDLSALTTGTAITIASTVGGGSSVKGTNGADTFTSGAGGDMMTGLGGNDLYYVDSADDRVIEVANAGADRVLTNTGYTLGAGQSIELFTTWNDSTTFAVNLTGNELAQTIKGNFGANVINGGGGTDILQGLGGNDLYYVDSADDRVIEVANAGADRVLTNTGYTLGAGQSIELFTTWNDGTTFAVNLTGNELAQTIKGNFGANVINGGGGTDILQGLGGNDLYYVDSADDRVIEVANAGADRVLTNTNYTLGAGQSIELFTTWNDSTTFAVNLTGNELAQTIKGNGGANVINGGLGNDTLTGLGGADTFAFKTALGSGNVDHITDFSHAADTIQLGKSVFAALGIGPLTEAAFKDLGVSGAMLDSSDRILYNHNTGALGYDADGSGSGSALVQFAILDTKPTDLAFNDFLIVA